MIGPFYNLATIYLSCLNKLDLETHLCVFYVMYRVHISLLDAKRLQLVYTEVIPLFVASPVLNQI